MAITEPGCGSDSANIQTTAVLDGDEYVINGEKIYVTAGGRCDAVVVWATLDKSKGRAAIKSFVVQKGTPGMRVERLEHKLGIKASDTATIIFEDCRVPKENLLGSPDIDTKQGFAGAMATFDNTRPLVAAMACGVARASLDLTRELLKDAGVEVDYDRPAQVQSAAAATFLQLEADWEAAHLLTLQAAWMADNRKANSLEASMAKAKAGRTASRRHAALRRAGRHRRLQRAGPAGEVGPRLEDPRHLRGHPADPAAHRRPPDPREDLGRAQVAGTPEAAGLVRSAWVCSASPERPATSGAASSASSRGRGCRCGCSSATRHEHRRCPVPRSRALSYGDPAAVEALTGVETLFMVSAAEDAERVAQHRRARRGRGRGRCPPRRLHELRRRRGDGRLPAGAGPRRDRGHHPRLGSRPHLPARQLLRRGVGRLRRGRWRRSAARPATAGWRRSPGSTSPPWPPHVLRDPGAHAGSDVRPHRAGGTHPRPRSPTCSPASRDGRTRSSTRRWRRRTPAAPPTALRTGWSTPGSAPTRPSATASSSTSATTSPGCSDDPRMSFEEAVRRLR